MKVAITSTGNSLESTLDERFGRCAFFLIYDTETDGYEFIPNKDREAEEGAGPSSVQLIASRGAVKVISGEFGMKMKSLLDSLKIQMIVIREPGQQITDIINKLKRI